MTEIEPYAGSTIVTRRDLRNAATDSWTEVLAEIGELAGKIAGTDFVPDSFRGSVPAVAATILTGRELGFAPMMALSSLHSIKGRVGLSAEAMRALVMQAGHEIVTTTSTSQQCTMKGRRAGSTEWTEVTWTAGDARQAKLGGENWAKYPRQMLQARTSAELCRLAFPDVIRGLASLEEITEYDVLPGDTAPPGEAGDAVKPTPVKRAPRKRAAAPKADPAAPPPLPGDEQTPGSEQTAEAPPLPEPEPTSPSAASADDSDGVAPPEADDVDAPAKDEGPGEEPAEGEADIEDADVVEEIFDTAPINQGQRSLLMVHFNRLGITDRDERLHMSSRIIFRDIESANDLTFKEATALLHVLESVRDAAALADLVEATTRQHTAEGA